MTAPDRAALGERAARALAWAPGESIAKVISRVTDLLVAVQEESEAKITRLRNVLAYEARVVEAHHEGYKSPPKSRVPFMIAQSKRMRQEALTPGGGHYERDISSSLAELIRARGAESNAGGR